MKCEQLTEGECLEWKDMDHTRYEDSWLYHAMSEEAYCLIASICDAAAQQKFEWMFTLINMEPEVTTRCEKNGAFRSILERAYEHAVACGHAAACCNLGNMYQSANNDSYKEDYATAMELYELGASRGDSQSAINLGYIYYYGRGTAIDYLRAYQCFAHSVFLEDNLEGYWKLGDLYAGGKGVAKSDPIAWFLYSKAYKLADGKPYGARPAHHMADYLMTGIEGTIDANPGKALELYVQAEIGYYALIDDGLDYYQTQLNQAIEGQTKARAAIQEKHREIRAE